MPAAADTSSAAQALPQSAPLKAATLPARRLRVWSRLMDPPTGASNCRLLPAWVSSWLLADWLITSSATNNWRALSGSTGMPSPGPTVSAL